MKALTLHEPWGSLIAYGYKRIETRGWNTEYSGPLAIHTAPNSPVSPFLEAFLLGKKTGDMSLADTLYPGGYWDAKDRSGCIVAVAWLAFCMKIPADKPAGWNICGDEPDYGVIPPPLPELAFGDYTPGRYAWILMNVRRLREPIPCKGKQRLWNWAAPANLEELLV